MVSFDSFIGYSYLDRIRTARDYGDYTTELDKNPCGRIRIRSVAV